MKYVLATTRTCWSSAPESSIASAPALRNSWTDEYIVRASTSPAGSMIVTTIPGPEAPTVPASTANCRARAAVCSSAASSESAPDNSSRRSFSSVAICSSSWSPRAVSPSRIRNRSPRRARFSRSSSSARTCTAAANPNRPTKTATPTWPRSGRARSAFPSRCRPVGAVGTKRRPCSASGRPGWSLTGCPFGSDGGSLFRAGPSPAIGPEVGRLDDSGTEHVTSDCRDVGEDANAKHHDDCGGQLRAYAKLVSEEDDEGSDQHVGHEGDHEDLVVEDSVHHSPQATEDRVERRYDGDRQIRLQAKRHVDVEEQAGKYAEQQSDGRNHETSPGSASRRAALAAGRVSDCSLRTSNWIPAVLAAASSQAPPAPSRKRLPSVRASPIALTSYGGLSGRKFTRMTSLADRIAVSAVTRCPLTATASAPAAQRPFTTC